MRNFTFYSPTEVVFGKETELKAGELVRRYGGSRVFLVYGGGSAVHSGLMDNVQQSLEKAGIVCETYGGVQPNPRLSFAREGVRRAIAFGADFLMAVGGGSVIDTAKGIAHGTANPACDLWDIWTGKAALEKSLPVGVILTIPAAGSETSDSAVLTNEQTGVKRGLSTNLNRPRFAVMNPSLAATLPRYQVGCGVVDIMMHTLDRYFTPTEGNEMTDQIAEALLRVTIENGRRVFRSPSDYDAMSEVMWCGSLSHNGLTGLGALTDFVPHKLGHELSARYDLAHGASLSAVWPAWARYVYREKPSRFARYARAVWGSTEQDTDKAANEGIDATERFFQSLEMPVSLGAAKGVGVLKETELQALAQRCADNAGGKIGSFRVLAYPEILNIYKLSNH